MSIVTVCGRKGGPGKTTTALSLAVELHRRRAGSVCYVDADNEDGEGSACWWADRSPSASFPVVPCGDEIRSMLPDLRAQYQTVIVDTPGAAELRTVYALGMSSLALMPCSPAALDIWKMGKTIQQVRAVQASFRRLHAAIVVVKVDRNTVAGRRAAATLKETGVQVLETELGKSVEYDYAIGAGLGPTTWSPSSTAAREVMNLADELLRRYRIGGPHGRR